MAIIVTLSAVSVPALQSIRGGSTVNKAVADLSSTLEMARAYAMANRTYVRILLGNAPAANGQVLPVLVAQPIFSANGSTSGDMTDTSAWPALSRPLVLQNLRIFDSLQGSQPIDTRNDVTPFGSNVLGAVMSPLKRSISGLGPTDFTGVIQFSPIGEARVSFEEPARYIKIAIDQPAGSNASSAMGKNPFILRLSGINGSIRVLRDGEVAL